MMGVRSLSGVKPLLCVNAAGTKPQSLISWNLAISPIKRVVAKWIARKIAAIASVNGGMLPKLKKG